MKARTKGAILASTVAAMFLASAAMAQEAAPSPASGTMQGQVKCVGANECKGKTACKSAANDCKGQNGCKGKGFVTASSEKECVDKGGKAAPASM
jgi:hypothetical protein